MNINVDASVCVCSQDRTEIYGSAKSALSLKSSDQQIWVRTSRQNRAGSLPVPVLVVPALSVYDRLSGGVLPFLGRVDVRDEHVLQAQVEALVLGVVREEEEGPEAQRDEGTEDEEEDELLREPQRGPVVGEGGGAGGQSGNPSARQGQQRRRRHGRGKTARTCL